MIMSVLLKKFQQIVVKPEVEITGNIPAAEAQKTQPGGRRGVVNARLASLG